MEDTAAARSFFEDGLRRADQGDWQGAADRFERTLALRYSPTVAFNLAKARIELGQFVAANELLGRIVRDPATPPGVRTSAEAALTNIEPHIGELTLEAEGPLETVMLSLDGRQITRAQLGAPIPADPGTHVLEARRNGELVASGETTIEEGGAGSIAITVPDPPPDVAVEKSERESELDHVLTPAAPQGDRDEEGGGIASEPWFWIVIGAVVIGGGVAAAVLLTGDDADPVVQGDFMPGVIEL